MRTPHRLPFPGQASSPDNGQGLSLPESTSADSSPAGLTSRKVGKLNKSTAAHAAQMKRLNEAGIKTWGKEPFVKGQQPSESLCALLNTIYQWADESLDPRYTTFLELPKLSALLRKAQADSAQSLGRYTNQQAAAFFAALDVPYIFTPDQDQEPQVALSLVGFRKWIVIEILANKTATRNWLGRLLQHIATTQGHKWKVTLPADIPKSCFEADLLAQRQAKYKYSKALGAVVDLEAAYPFCRESGTKAIQAPAQPFHDDFLHPNTDGRGYQLARKPHEQPCQRPPMEPPPPAPWPPPHQQSSGVPRWLEVYGGRNVGQFEPGRLQQGMPIYPYTNWLLANGSAVPGSDWIQRQETQRMYQQQMMGGGMYMGLMGMGLGTGYGMGGMPPWTMRRRGGLCNLFCGNQGLNGTMGGPYPGMMY